MSHEKQLSHGETRWSTQAFPLILACDNWQDPRNVGMAFRLADAFGVEAIWLGGTTPVPPNRKISRTARSTASWVPYHHQVDLASSLQEAKKSGYTLVGVEITSESKALEEHLQEITEQAVILVLGAEQSGISEEVLSLLDSCVHIPMYGRNSSLNVATALAITLNAWVTRLVIIQKTNS